MTLFITVTVGSSSFIHSLLQRVVHSFIHYYLPVLSSLHTLKHSEDLLFSPLLRDVLESIPGRVDWVDSPSRFKSLHWSRFHPCFASLIIYIPTFYANVSFVYFFLCFSFQFSLSFPCWCILLYRSLSSSIFLHSMDLAVH